MTRSSYTDPPKMVIEPEKPFLSFRRVEGSVAFQQKACNGCGMSFALFQVVYVRELPKLPEDDPNPDTHRIDAETFLCFLCYDIAWRVERIKSESGPMFLKWDEIRNRYVK